MKAFVTLTVVLCLVAPAFAAETYDAGTKTLTVTAASLAAQVDPLGEVQDFSAASYVVPSMSKAAFNALSGLKTITFNDAPNVRQGTTKIIAYYDASNYVTFSGFGNVAGYNYSGGTSSGRRAHSGSQDWHQLGLIGGDNLSGPFHVDAATAGLEGLNWLKMSISVSQAGKGVTAIGFIVDGRDDQNTQDGSIWVTLNDASEVKMDYTPFAGVANSGLFFGYQAPAGKFITGIEGTRLNKSGNSFLALDDLTFVIGGSGAAPTCWGDFDGSGLVNGDDLAVLAYAWLATPADANWWAPADQNGDNVINGDDLAILAYGWLQCIPKE